MTWHIAV